MPHVVALLERFKLQIMSLHLGDSNNIFYYKGEGYKKKSAVMPPGGKWAGLHPTDMSKAASNAYKATPHWTECNNEAYECGELQSLSLADFFKKYAGASPEETALWFAYSGYNLYHSDIQSSIYVHDGVFYGSDINTHEFVQEGYMKLVLELESAAGKGANGIVAEMQTELLSLDYTESGGQRFNLATVRHPDGSTEQISAKRVVIGATGEQVGNIKGLEDCVSSERWSAVTKSKSMPLFKAFMEFEKDSNGKGWWKHYTSAEAGQGGLQHGKSTTDLRCRQIHYYDDEDLLIYCSDGEPAEEKYASQWDAHFKEDLKLNRKQGQPGSAMHTMWEQVRTVHVSQGIPADEIPEPLWDNCIWKYWSSGSHKWKKNCDVHAQINLIGDGSRDDSGVFIVGDAFSDMQGWVEGAINTCNVAYEKFNAGMLASNPSFRDSAGVQGTAAPGQVNIEA